MDKVAAKHLRIFDGKPVHIDPTHVGPDINWLSLDKRKPSMSIIGSHSSRSLFENPASNTAARVSLPLTMSNILRTDDLSAGYPPHPYRPSRPPRLREARGIGPSPISRQPPFVKFFRRSAERQKNPEKEPTDLHRAHCGARAKTIWSAGGGDIRPDLTSRKRFLVDIAEITRFPQNPVARHTNCGKRTIQARIDHRIGNPGSRS